MTTSLAEIAQVGWDSLLSGTVSTVSVLRFIPGPTCRMFRSIFAQNVCNNRSEKRCLETILGWCPSPGAGLMRIWSRPSGEIYKDVKVPGESRVTGHQVRSFNVFQLWPRCLGTRNNAENWVWLTQIPARWIIMFIRSYYIKWLIIVFVHKYLMRDDDYQSGRKNSLSWERKGKAWLDFSSITWKFRKVVLIWFLWTYQEYTRI